MPPPSGFAIRCQIATATPPENPSAQVTAVSACSGHGFKIAPAIGEIAVGMAMGEAPAFDEIQFIKYGSSDAVERALTLGEIDFIPANERVKRVLDEQLWDRRRKPR